jgi:hypothetical protein
MIPSLSPSAGTRADAEAGYVAWARAQGSPGGGRARQARFVADFVRSGLCRLGAADGRAGPVHVQRLLAAVRSQLHRLSPPDALPWDPDT